MARGKIPFDAAQAERAKAKLSAAAAGIPAAFEVQAEDPKSEALPAIWSNWDDFTAKSVAMETAVSGLDTSSLEDLRAGLGPIGRSCGGCHKSYRIDK